MLDSKDTKKLFFECLCQIHSLCLSQIDAGHDDFSAGERGMIGKSFSNRARNILKEEVGQTSFDFLRNRWIQSDIMQTLLTGRTKRVEYVESVICLDCPWRGQASVSELEAILEICEAWVV